LKWSKENLAAVSTKILARSLHEEVEEDSRITAASKSALSINLEEFLKS
jgi:hypothetical protein